MQVYKICATQHPVSLKYSVRTYFTLEQQTALVSQYAVFKVLKYTVYVLKGLHVIHSLLRVLFRHGSHG